MGAANPVGARSVRHEREERHAAVRVKVREAQNSAGPHWHSAPAQYRLSSRICFAA